MAILSKRCAKCERDRPFSEFYARAGYRTPENPPTEAGHTVSECKACMKLRSQSTNHLSVQTPRTPTEIFALQYLRQQRIFACTGKAASYPHVDVVAWGCVRIEVKYAKLQALGKQMGYRFVATPQQSKHGFRAEVVMLICEDEQGRAHHLFDAIHPVFYMGERVKAGFEVVVGKQEAIKHADNRVVMLQEMMDEARDAVHLIEEHRLRISRALA
jgi:hypothetical protein